MKNLLTLQIEQSAANMKVKEIVEKLNLQVFCGEENLENEVRGGYASDLLSDVVGFARKGCLWVTLQTHRNVIAIASLKDLAAVILVKGYQPDEDMLAQARVEGIPVLGTTEQAFETIGRIYSILNA